MPRPTAFIRLKGKGRKIRILFSAPALRRDFDHASDASSALEAAAR
jgi:hypothetical protein